MKREYRLIAIVTSMMLIFGIPALINIMYPPHKPLISAWSPGDLLSYLSSILVGGATIYLGFQANKMNKRIMENEMIAYKSYVSVMLKECELRHGSVEFSGCHLKLILKNITKIPIVGAMAYKSQKIGIDGDWNEKSFTTSEVISIGGMKNINIKDDYLTMRYHIENTDLSNAIFSVEVELKNIYGLKTKQYINLVIENGELIEESTREV